jgi:hypothetical protein
MTATQFMTAGDGTRGLGAALITTSATSPREHLESRDQSPRGKLLVGTEHDRYP